MILSAAKPPLLSWAPFLTAVGGKEEAWSFPPLLILTRPPTAPFHSRTQYNWEDLWFKDCFVEATHLGGIRGMACVDLLPLGYVSSLFPRIS